MTLNTTNALQCLVYLRTKYESQITGITILCPGPSENNGKEGLMKGQGGSVHYGVLGILIIAKSSLASRAFSLVPRPLSPKERPGTHCLRMHIIFPVFRGFVK